MNRYLHGTLSGGLLVLFLLIQPPASAENPRADLVLRSKPILVNSEFAVQVFIGSADPVNTFDFQIRYPTSTIEFLSLRTQGSIANVWVISKEKTAPGLIALGGGIVRGFKGDRGEIATLLFRAKQEGETNIDFKSANIYYADGLGTLAKTDTKALTVKVISPREEFTLESGLLWSFFAAACLIFILLFSRKRRR